MWSNRLENGKRKELTAYAPCSFDMYRGVTGTIFTKRQGDTSREGCYDRSTAEYLRTRPYLDGLIMPFTECSFEEAAVSYEPLIKKMIKQYRGGMTYDEAYQMGLIALWEATRTYDSARGYFPAYVKFHLTRTFLTVIRNRQKDSERHIWNDTLIAGVSILGDDQADLFVKNEVERCKALLTQREYSWLYFTVIKGFRTADLANLFDVSQHTVRSWKKSAVKKLREKLKEKK